MSEEPCSQYDWRADLSEGGRRISEGWFKYLTERRKAQSGALVDRAMASEETILPRIAELEAAEGERRHVCEAELRWLKSLSYKGWLGDQFRSFEFMRVEHPDFHRSTWRNLGLGDFVARVRPYVPESVDLEVLAENVTAYMDEMYFILRSLELIVRQCDLLAEVCNVRHLLSEFELSMIRFGLVYCGVRCNEFEFTSKDGRLFCVLTDREGTVLRRRKSTDFDEYYSRDLFGVRKRQWMSFLDVQRHHERLANDSLIDLPPEALRRKAKQRIQDLDDYEKKYGFVHFGEKAWLLDCCSGDDSISQDYDSWAKTVLLKNRLFPLATEKENDTSQAVAMSSTQELYFLPKFHEFEMQPARIKLDSVRVTVEKGTVRPAEVFHILHNFIYWVDEAGKLDISNWLDGHAAGVHQVLFKQAGEIVLEFANAWGATLEFPIAKEFLFLD